MDAVATLLKFPVIDWAGNLFSIPCPKCGREVGKACGGWDDHPYVCQERAEALRKRRESESEQAPHQNTFHLYDRASDGSLYCWILESRVVTTAGDEVMGWSLASGSASSHNHFRTPFAAEAEKKRRLELVNQSSFLQAVRFEYRSALKYLGYIPSEDEAWLA